MILFVNGPFGIGKTSAARVLVEKTPNAMLYDPEIIGYVLRRIPRLAREVNNYQNYALWRKLAFRGLPERVSGPGFRDGSADGRPHAREGCGQDPEKLKYTDRLG